MFRLKYNNSFEISFLFKEYGNTFSVDMDKNEFNNKDDANFAILSFRAKCFVQCKVTEEEFNNFFGNDIEVVEVIKLK